MGKLPMRDSVPPSPLQTPSSSLSTISVDVVDALPLESRRRRRLPPSSPGGAINDSERFRFPSWPPPSGRPYARLSLLSFLS